MVTFAQFSDTHIDGTPGTTERSARVLRYLDRLSEPPAAVVITGDITDHGSAAEYGIAREVLRARVPVLRCPGNHDERVAFARGLLDRTDAEIFAPGGAARPIDQALRLPGLLILACDSSIPGQVSGGLEATTLQWLRDELAGAGAMPVIIAVHHPPADLPFPGGAANAVHLADPAGLAALIDEHPQIVAVLSGHLHAGIRTTFAGRPLIVAPAVWSAPELPAVAGRASDRPTPLELLLHTLDPAGHLTTRTILVR